MTTSASTNLLLIVPHPDDEVYGAAGLIMRATDAGERVALVTLTRGEKGRTLGLANSPQELAELREAELRACLGVLGVQEHRHLTYPDGGLKDVDVSELAGVAANAIGELRPHVVLTFPPNGSNGHPDHVATSAAVRRAFESLDERPELWFYAGPPPEDPKLLEAYLPPNVEMDASPYLERKLKAIAQHRTQALSTVDFMRKFPGRILRETFHRVERPS
ncbi:PIG-L deacetylase family protein [Deinococcus yavapaiensis]|uniref:LmbE family N-acetylglucosaminyl deacetylase n=1 Tax=Deinococcus yavapaiensis KR-236 TaxID=694435 RepID=A0A318S905_9DEIO|nr:PIG-L deacetylase family protein [Deinococcus yavapaiensis]PYE55185.1 LmbE family N-acetylglucosaminyl deacetylase [Deinococcus yavapaiensis KR-236]